MQTNVYIGWDSREDIAYQVARHSILSQTKNMEVNVIPLKLTELREQGIYTRDVDSKGSTEFTFSRFLIPYLNDYKGWALFVDCDVLCLEDLSNLFKHADNMYYNTGVMCAKHDYTPSEKTKMDGQKQTVYPRKNWSSVVLWNCGYEKNKILTPELVNRESGMYLHRFMWLDDEEIGEIPYQWNYLVGWYNTNDPKMLHYTEGGPWFDEYKNCEYADLWLKEKARLDD